VKSERFFDPSFQKPWTDRIIYIHIYETSVKVLINVQIYILEKGSINGPCVVEEYVGVHMND
jgi:hypothetical protein